ncbi:LANO_0B02652g1_1 [Lachancea nothofagi CBS 11611]|uniref:Efficient mitochondria targeting-associated protein 19 n=1 Tax=Lachancea nothofagi CBS 11611 TaxID=1266666 RepID=A0A1G4IWS2_9SACH|nr:LANO_0B02652g1_1 [Lachancea nothofagi CBS 11611]
MLSTGQQKFYYYYFIAHIFTTILVDSIVVLPERFQVTKPLVDYHIAFNNDFLLYEKPSWLWWFILIECVGQLPGFFWFAYKIRQLWALKTISGEDKHIKMQLATCERSLSWWLRLYGWNAASTTFICLYTVWTRGYYPDGDLLPMLVSDKLKLMAVYVPYLLIPLRLCFI